MRIGWGAEEALACSQHRGPCSPARGWEGALRCGCPLAAEPEITRPVLEAHGAERSGRVRVLELTCPRLFLLFRPPGLVGRGAIRAEGAGRLRGAHGEVGRPPWAGLVRTVAGRGFPRTNPDWRREGTAEARERGFCPPNLGSAAGPCAMPARSLRPAPARSWLELVGSAGGPHWGWPWWVERSGLPPFPACRGRTPRLAVLLGGIAPSVSAVSGGAQSPAIRHAGQLLP